MNSWIKSTVHLLVQISAFKIFSAALLLLFLLSCGNEVTRENKIPEKNLIGRWHISRDPYAKGEIYLNTDHSFVFSESGHLSETYSTGKWEVNKDTLLLNSIMPGECLYLTSFAPACEELYIAIKPKIEVTIENCEPKSYTKFYTEFRQEKFVMSTDSLSYVNMNKNCANKQYPYKIYR